MASGLVAVPMAPVVSSWLPRFTLISQEGTSSHKSQSARVCMGARGSMEGSFWLSTATAQLARVGAPAPTPWVCLRTSKAALFACQLALTT